MGVCTRTSAAVEGGCSPPRPPTSSPARASTRSGGGGPQGTACVHMRRGMAPPEQLACQGTLSEVRPRSATATGASSNAWHTAWELLLGSPKSRDLSVQTVNFQEHALLKILSVVGGPSPTTSFSLPPFTPVDAMPPCLRPRAQCWAYEAAKRCYILLVTQPAPYSNPGWWPGAPG